MSVYIDTSALMKRYLREAFSAEFDAFVVEGTEDLTITALTVTEFEAVLSRRRRQKDFDAAFATRTRQLFGDDLQHAVWAVRPFPLEAFAQAQQLLQPEKAVIATLDALHLASARALGCKAFATADKQLARAARASGLAVHSFA